jgi:hypothetical protein
LCKSLFLEGMKYQLRAVSLKQVNQTDEVLVWFRGPLSYKIFGGKRKFIFPWNVTRINLLNHTLFPVTFWGIKGTQRLKIEDVILDVIKWNPDSQWFLISKKSNFDNFDETAIINAIHREIPESIDTLNMLKEKTQIKYIIPEILDTTKEIIPQSFLIAKN